MLKLKLQSLATWCEVLTRWKRPWCWEILKAGGEGDNRGWDGWMASPTQWTWVWASSWCWWSTGKLGVLQSMGHKELETTEWELNWTEVGHSFSSKEQVSFNFMAAVTICSDFGVQENKVCLCFHCFPHLLPSSDGTRCHYLSFLTVEFYTSFFTLLFHSSEDLWRRIENLVSIKLKRTLNVDLIT